MDPSGRTCPAASYTMEGSRLPSPIWVLQDPVLAVAVAVPGGKAAWGRLQPTHEPAARLATHRSAGTMGLDGPRSGMCWLGMELLRGAGSGSLSADHVPLVMGLTALLF